jgi:hypothetical protein
MKPSHLAYLCQVVSMKNRKHPKLNSLGILTLKDEAPVWRSCPSTPNELLLDHFLTLHSSNELKFGTLLYHYMSKGFNIFSCLVGLIFSKLPWSNSKNKVPFVMHVQELLQQTCQTQCGVIVHHILSTQHQLTDPKRFIHSPNHLVNPSLTKFCKIQR